MAYTTKDDKSIKVNNKSGELLRLARASKGLTLPEAALTVGCAASTLKRYESHGIPPQIRAKRALSLCRAYEISADLLLCAAGERA